MLSTSSQSLVKDCMAQVKLLIDGELREVKEDDMEVDEGNIPMATLLELDIPQFKVR